MTQYDISLQKNPTLQLQTKALKLQTRISITFHKDKQGRSMDSKDSKMYQIER